MERTDSLLEAALSEPESSIGDDGFTDSVMRGLPRRRLSREAARRWTLGGAAAIGSIVTSVLGAPLETAFSAFVLEGSVSLALVAPVALIGLVLIPVAWVFYTR
jgi:anti-sigma factor RsiW